jgi:hypothetical protein
MSQAEINIIGISGYIGCGKDTVGKIIRKLTGVPIKSYVTIEDGEFKPMMGGSEWKIKKFSDKLKKIASILTGIPVDRFEDREFKNSILGKEWWNNGYNNLDPLPGVEQIMQDEPMTVRKFLQTLGTEAMRDNLHENVWVNALFSDYMTSGIPVYPKWVITDCRFPNEATAIKDRGGIVVRINRPIAGALHSFHSSETQLDTWDFDYKITNDGTLEDLTAKVTEMLHRFNIIS